MKTVGHKGDEDVCLDAMGKLMKNGANPYISLQIFEGFLDFRELGVIFPKRSWGLLSKVAPQQVLALASVGFAKFDPVNSETKVKFCFRFFRVWPFLVSAFSFSSGSDWVTLNRSIRRLARPLFSPRQF